MKLHRILAIVRRHILLSFHRFDRILNIFYWPFINIVIWGVTSVWLQKISHDPHIATMILSGLVLWQIVFRVNLETAKGLYEEVIHHNVVNLFSTPLTLSEWIAAMMLLGILNMVLVTLCSAATVWLLYGISLMNLGWHLVPFMLSLLVSGWFIGFFICGLLIYWGLKATDFLYTIGYLFLPFSAIYYPVAALPDSVQVISNLLPTTPIFEAMRQVLSTGTYQSEFLWTSIYLNFVYLSLSLLFFRYMFEQSRVKGLGHLD